MEGIFLPLASVSLLAGGFYYGQHYRAKEVMEEGGVRKTKPNTAPRKFYWFEKAVGLHHSNLTPAARAGKSLLSGTLLCTTAFTGTIVVLSLCTGIHSMDQFVDCMEVKGKKLKYNIAKTFNFKVKKYSKLEEQRDMEYLERMLDEK